MQNFWRILKYFSNCPKIAKQYLNTEFKLQKIKAAGHKIYFEAQTLKKYTRSRSSMFDQIPNSKKKNAYLKKYSNKLLFAAKVNQL